jgi:hypothetical protein
VASGVLGIAGGIGLLCAGPILWVTLASAIAISSGLSSTMIKGFNYIENKTNKDQLKMIKRLEFEKN